MGLVAGLLLAAIYSVVEHENGLRRYALAIFGVPVVLTISKLLLSLGIRSKENDERNEG